MTTYWIADQADLHALVDGEEELRVWTLVRGWHEANEPSPVTQTCVKNVSESLTGSIPYGALASGWADMGWEPGPPPIPTDPTRPPPVPVPGPIDGGGESVATKTTKTAPARPEQGDMTRG